MKKLKLTVFLSALMMLAPLASNAQHLGVGTNVLGWASAAPNIGLDIGLSKHLALVVDGAYKPFHLGDKQANFWGVQPELRIYPRYRFAGHYIGVEGHYAEYHDFGLGTFAKPTETFAYRGNLYGAGITYGYSWMLSKSWNLEGFVGIGYTYLNDSKMIAYDPSDEPYGNSQLSDEYRIWMHEGTRVTPAGVMIGDGLNRQFIGLSRVGLKFTYFIF